MAILADCLREVSLSSILRIDPRGGRGWTARNCLASSIISSSLSSGVLARSSSHSWNDSLTSSVSESLVWLDKSGVGSSVSVVSSVSFNGGCGWMIL